MSKLIPGTSDESFWLFPEVQYKTSAGVDCKWTKYVCGVSMETYNKFTEHPSIADLELCKKINPKILLGDNPPRHVAYHFTKSGQITTTKGTPGKIRNTVPTVVLEGKNIGRKNETTPFEQALKDSNSQYNKQMDKADVISISDGKSPEGEDSIKSSETTHDAVTYGGVKLYPPMLAKSFDGMKEKVMYVQRKYNGTRCMAVNNGSEIILYSRTRKPLSAPHIAAALKNIPMGYYIDGELYTHGESLQEQSGKVRRKDNEDTSSKYMIYDVYIPEVEVMGFLERFKILKTLKLSDPCILVETFRVLKPETIDAHFKKFLEEGYEGAIIRADYPYVLSYSSRRSSGLFKMKKTHDAEFELIGFGQGAKGKGVGQLMLICRANKDNEFAVTPAMKEEDRRKIYKLLSERPKLFDEKLKGKMMVVTFDEYTKSGVPSRARTEMLFRDIGQDFTYTVNFEEEN